MPRKQLNWYSTDGGGKPRNFANALQVMRILQSRRIPMTVQDLQQETTWSRSAAYRALSDAEFCFRDMMVYDPSRHTYQLDREKCQEAAHLWLNEDELSGIAAIEYVLENLATDGLLASTLEPLKHRVRELLEAQRIKPSAWYGRIKFVPVGHRRCDPIVLRRTFAALLRDKKLQIVYQKLGSKIQETRVVSPQTLLRYRENWYLDVWCHERGDIRTLAVNRIQHAKLLPKAARRLSGTQLSEHFTHSYGIFSGPARATAAIRFTGIAAEEVAHEQWHPEQVGERQENGDYVLRVPYSSHQELIMDVFRWLPQAEVIEPPELREEAKERLRLALQKHL